MNAIIPFLTTNGVRREKEVEDFSTAHVRQYDASDTARRLREASWPDVSEYYLHASNGFEVWLLEWPSRLELRTLPTSIIPDSGQTVANFEAFLKTFARDHQMTLLSESNEDS